MPQSRIKKITRPVFAPSALHVATVLSTNLLKRSQNLPERVHLNGIDELLKDIAMHARHGLERRIDYRFLPSMAVSSSMIFIF